MIRVNDIVEINIHWLKYPSVGMVIEVFPSLRAKLKEGAIITLVSKSEVKVLRPDLAEKFRKEFK